MVTLISSPENSIGDTTTSRTMWITPIHIHCLNGVSGVVYFQRLIACLYGVMVICMRSAENSTTVLIKLRKQLAKDTPRKSLLIGKGCRIILTLFSGKESKFIFILLYNISFCHLHYNLSSCYKSIG